MKDNANVVMHTEGCVGNKMNMLEGKPIEWPEIWIIGSSVVKDMSVFKGNEKVPSLATQMKDTVKSIRWYGEPKLSITDLLSSFKKMLKDGDKPDIIVFQCGEYDVCQARNVDYQKVMQEDMREILREVPNVKLVWSQMIPPWMSSDVQGESLAKSRRRINCFMMKAFCSDDVNGAFLYQPQFRTNRKSKFFKDKKDGYLHLTDTGIQMYLMQLKAGIKYIMSGKGSIYPYLHWPPERMSDLAPEDICMLCKEHILSIDKSMLRSMSKEHIQQFSIDQIDMFQPLQRQWLYCRHFIRNLSPTQIKAFTVDRFKLMNMDQITIWMEEHEDTLTVETKQFLEQKQKNLKKKIAKQKAKEEKATDYDCMSSGESEFDYDQCEDETYEEVEIRVPVKQERGRGRGRGRGRFRGRGGFEGGHGSYGRSHNDRDFDVHRYSKSGHGDDYRYERRESYGERESRRRSSDGYRHSSSHRDRDRSRERERRRRHSSESNSSSESEYSSDSSRSSRGYRRRRRSRSPRPRRLHPAPDYQGYPQHGQPMPYPGMPMYPMGGIPPGSVPPPMPFPFIPGQIPGMPAPFPFPGQPPYGYPMATPQITAPIAATPQTTTESLDPNTPPVYPSCVKSLT